MGIYMDMHGCAFAVLATHYDDARHAPPALEGTGTNNIQHRMDGC
jgi:hypothetical protein